MLNARWLRLNCSPDLGAIGKNCTVDEDGEEFARNVGLLLWALYHFINSTILLNLLGSHSNYVEFKNNFISVDRHSI